MGVDERKKKMDYFFIVNFEKRERNFELEIMSFDFKFGYHRFKSSD